MYILIKENFNKFWVDCKDVFILDSKVKINFSMFVDYCGLGYDRGYLVFVVDMVFFEEVMREIFFMSNISL